MAGTFLSLPVAVPVQTLNPALAGFSFDAAFRVHENPHPGAPKNADAASAEFVVCPKRLICFRTRADGPSGAFGINQIG